MACVMLCFFFFFKQKTAYEMRISDWSSDVCSSDLKIGFQSITLAKALLGDVTNDAAGSRVYAVPLLEHRDDDPLRFLGIVEQIVVLKAVEIPVVAHVLPEMLEDQVELDREAKCLPVLPECRGLEVVR